MVLGRSTIGRYCENISREDELNPMWEYAMVRLDKQQNTCKKRGDRGHKSPINKII